MYPVFVVYKLMYRGIVVLVSGSILPYLGFLDLNKVCPSSPLAISYVGHIHLVKKPFRSVVLNCGSAPATL